MSFTRKQENFAIITFIKTILYIQFGRTNKKCSTFFLLVLTYLLATGKMYLHHVIFLFFDSDTTLALFLHLHVNTIIKWEHNRTMNRFDESK